MVSFDKFKAGLPLEDFLSTYATPTQQARWKDAHAAITLTDAQKKIVTAFVREMNVLVLAGAWCGDCSGQCPIFEHFAELAPTIQIRYLDRDVHADVQRELQINGGNRVPVVVFFSEDGFEVARYGERTVSRYRAMMQEMAGANCPTGLVRNNDPLIAQVTQDWLNEFERVQWTLRLSSRLRSKHGD